MALLSILLVAATIVLACLKRPRFSILAALVAVAAGYLPFSFCLDMARSAEARANRKKDFNIVIVAAPAGSESVSVDGVLVEDERVMFDGTIDFAIDFGDSRSLTGQCGSFQLIREGGQLKTIRLLGLRISHSDRTSFLTSFPQIPRGVQHDGRTESYTVWFTRVSPDHEQFECIWQ